MEKGREGKKEKVLSSKEKNGASRMGWWVVAVASTCVLLVTLLCPVLHNPMDCSTPASLSFTISQTVIKPMPIESVM